MKICLVGDVHWSTYSSILRSRGERYSTRLEYIIDSLNWVEGQCKEREVGKVIYLGDFFDKETLNSEELTALTDIKWYNDIGHVFITGNHEVATSNLDYASCMVFDNKDNFKTVREVEAEIIGSTQLVYLPYISEYKRKPLSEILEDFSTSGKRIILSHNDIKGIQMGMIKSQVGFDMDDIEENCDLFINGHIHNGLQITNKIYNIGNLTGQNFCENAYKYKHKIVFIDTDTLSLESVENPKSICFYQVNYHRLCKDIETYRNAVISVNCTEEEAPKAQEILDKSANVLCSRLNIERSFKTIDNKEDVTKLQTQDHLKQFESYVYENIGTSDIVKEELQQIMM